MRSAWIIAKRDLGSFFNSPIFYIVTTVFLIIYSFIFFNILNFFSFQSFQAGQFQAMGMNLNLNEMVVEPSLQNMSVILLMIIPIITMRSFADEKDRKSTRLNSSHKPISYAVFCLKKKTTKKKKNNNINLMS